MWPAGPASVAGTDLQKRGAGVACSRNRPTKVHIGRSVLPVEHNRFGMLPWCTAACTSYQSLPHQPSRFHRDLAGDAPRADVPGGPWCTRPTCWSTWEPTAPPCPGLGRVPTSSTARSGLEHRGNPRQGRVRPTSAFTAPHVKDACAPRPRSRRTTSAFTAPHVNLCYAPRPRSRRPTSRTRAPHVSVHRAPRQGCARTTSTFAAHHVSVHRAPRQPLLRPTSRVRAHHVNLCCAPRQGLRAPHVHVRRDRRQRILRNRVHGRGRGSRDRTGVVEISRGGDVEISRGCEVTDPKARLPRPRSTPPCPGPAGPGPRGPGGFSAPG